MDILKKHTIKRMSVKELWDFIFENYYKQIEFVKEKSYYYMIFCCLQISYNPNPDPYNAKEHYQSLTRKKNTK